MGSIANKSKVRNGGKKKMAKNKKNDIFADIADYESGVDSTSWNGTVKDYIEMVQHNPKLAQLSHARVLDMIESAGIEFDKNDTAKIDPRYKFFNQDLFGVHEPIRKIVKYLKAAASGSQVGRRILLLYGPTSSGKSQLASLLKNGIEAYSRTEDGSLYAVADCPIHENPLNIVPIALRKKFQKDYGIKIDPLARPCPVCQFNLGDKYKDNWLNVPVKRIFLSEMNRIGIGTFLPGDSKSQSITELVGSVDFSKLGEFGVESDPRAYKFDGELNVANRGIMEMIEMLKVDPKFLYVLLTLAQEKTIKTERFPLIYADEFIIAHSVVGDSPVPYRENGDVKFDTISSLTEKNNTDIEVLAVNMETKNPEWTAVKSFHKHPFTGNLIKTIQNNGVVETTWNHSIYSTDHEWFYPEEKKDVLTVRDLPPNYELGSFGLQLDNDLVEVEGRAYHKLVKGYKGNGAYKKHFVKSTYNLPQDESTIKDLLTVFSWYITEGHVNDDHCIISQNDTKPLMIIKKSAESISSSVASLQDRSDKEDKTSRLHLSTKVWKKIIEKNCGKYSEGKKIPDFVFGLPDALKMHFFNELIKGDGTKIPSNKSCTGEQYLEKCFRYKTTSKMLAAQVCFLASQLGFDFGITHAYTVSGKEAFEIRYRGCENVKNKNKTEEVYVEDLDVYDIECVGNHSFVAGVGSVLCHNTNETEYRRFLADAKLEALHDRIIVHKFPYNLILDDEVKIYEKLVAEADFGDIHIAPLTLQIASMFAVLTRLETGKDQNLTLLKKMQLYNSQDVEGFTHEDIKNIKSDTEREGMDGVSPRYIFNCVADCFTKYDMSCITPIDILRAIKENFETNAKLNKEDIGRFDDLLTIVVEQYTLMAKNEVQKAFFVNFDSEIQNLLNNYIDNVGAYLGDTKVVDEFGDHHEPNKHLMRGIEEKVGVSDAAKDSFRQEVYRKVLKANTEDGFDYKSHAKLRESLEKQLFSERSDVIRLTVSSRNPDPESLQKLNQVIDTLVKEYGYTADSANQLLRYVNSLMAQTT